MRYQKNQGHFVPQRESTAHENALLVLWMHFSVLSSLKETSLDYFVHIAGYLLMMLGKQAHTQNLHSPSQSPPTILVLKTLVGL